MWIYDIPQHLSENSAQEAEFEGNAQNRRTDT